MRIIEFYVSIQEVSDIPAICLYVHQFSNQILDTGDCQEDALGPATDLPGGASGGVT